MSASPTSTAAVSSAKRPLEDPSSPSAPTDLPDAKRPALDKVVKDDSGTEFTKTSELPSSGGPKIEDVKPVPAPVTNGTHDLPNNAAATADAPNGTSQAAAPENLPIQSTASQSDRATSHPPSNLPPQDETNWIHIRAVISSAEAATCIGKGGENVTQI